jgi:hypothetical protein
MAEIVPVTEWPDYSTTPTGGDVMTQDLNAPYDKVRDFPARGSGTEILMMNAAG